MISKRTSVTLKNRKSSPSTKRKSIKSPISTNKRTSVVSANRKVSKTIKSRKVTKLQKNRNTPPKIILESDKISQSKKEKSLVKMLRKRFYVKIQAYISNSYHHPYDILLVDFMTLIEFDGDYWHSKKNPNWSKSHDERRRIEAERRGYTFIIVKESEWDKSKSKVMTKIIREITKKYKLSHQEFSS